MVGVPSGPAIVTNEVAVPVHETVTTICVAPDRTLKLYVGGVVTVTVNVAVWMSVPSVAVTITLNVPDVVRRVGTVSVAEAGYELTEDGVTVQVTPVGQPLVTESVTVVLKLPPAVRLSVDEAVPPAPTVWEVGLAVIVKSLGGGAQDWTTA